MILSAEQQCQANIRAWAAFRGFTLPDPICVEPDRCFYPRSAALDEAITRMLEQKIIELGNFRNHGETAVAGFRETVGRCSAQIIVHRDFIEIDFDLANPWDVVGIVGHAAEVLKNRFGKRKTDPHKIAELLKERGIHG